MPTAPRSLLLASLVLLALSPLAAAERRGVSDHAWYSAGGEFDAAACYHCRVLFERALLEEGAESRRYETGTGRDLRNYPPSRPADLLHMRLDLDIPDMNTPVMRCRQTITLAPIGRPLDVLPLNAVQMEIAGVRRSDDGRASMPFSYDGRVLSITFDPPVPPGQQTGVEIEYSVNDPADGLFWTPEMPEWPGRPAQIHTQGQPETNRYWFPIHDFPNERLTTEIVATVPEGFLVSANGREAAVPATRNGRTTFHWVQDKDHVPYLVTFIVGKFDVKDVAPPGFAFPMPVYVPPGLGHQIDQTYGRTADMVRVFERLFGLAYPWDRYAQLVVWNFGAGGMENTAATTMYDTAIFDSKALLDSDLDGLISHELAHQWFGDLITCKSWAHIWLNEGWATYSTGLWYEHRDGYDAGYRAYMHRTMRGVAGRDRLMPGAENPHPPMVSRIYEHPWETFRRTANPYPKGASVLHMLRMKLGDDLFFKAVASYVNRYKNDTVETDDFRKELEDVSGVSLERFFEQWCMRPGTPKVHVRARWDAREKALRLRVDQQQLIDAEHPAFVFDLPIEVFSAASPGEEPVKFVLPVDGVRHEQTIALEGEPAFVLVDPDLHVLMTLGVDMPASWLRNQLSTSRSIASRLDAAEFLKGRSGRATIGALAARLDDRSEDHAVRSAAASTLGSLSAADALIASLNRGIDDARPRRAALSALGTIGGTEAVVVLARHADDPDESYACRSAALEALGRHADASHLPIFERALKSSSQHDQVRTGALEGLRRTNLPEGIAVAAPCTRLGNLSRVRPVAIGTVARLAEHDKEQAYRIVEPILFDREHRARRAAIEALVEIKHRDGLDALDRLASTTNHDRTRTDALDARARLAAEMRKPEGARSLQSEIERLRGELKRLESRIREDEKDPAANQ